MPKNDSGKADKQEMQTEALVIAKKQEFNPESKIEHMHSFEV